MREEKKDPCWANSLQNPFFKMGWSEGAWKLLSNATFSTTEAPLD